MRAPPTISWLVSSIAFRYGSSPQDHGKKCILTPNLGLAIIPEPTTSHVHSPYFTQQGRAMCRSWDKSMIDPSSMQYLQLSTSLSWPSETPPQLNRKANFQTMYPGELALAPQTMPASRWLVVIAGTNDHILRRTLLESC